MAAILAPGDTILGKYRVERVIGQGGMGMVVAARHMSLGELFAIKLMLNIEGVTGQQAFDRFLREARICASLKGEHVVKVQDVGELEDGRPYMVMEYLEGQNLGSFLDKKGPMSMQNAAAVILQACDALAEAHRLGIVHRDIKPPNMFLTRTPNGKIRLKLLDFGISKRFGAETKVLTNTGAMMGSPLYMSPEQLTDARAVGPQTDIWAMGVVLYELVTGKVPFDGEMIFQVIQEILNKKPQLPSEHRPSLPLEVDKIVERALRKDPAQRYATIEEFARDVRQMLQANSVISTNLHVSSPSEPEVSLDIDATTLDAASYGPTLEANSEHFVDNPVKVGTSDSGPKLDRVSKNGESVSDEIASGRSVQTPSDMAPNVATPKSSKSLSPVALGMGAVLLLVLGGAGMYVIQGGSRTEKSDLPTSVETRDSNPVPAVSMVSPSSTAPPPPILPSASSEPAIAVVPASSPTTEPGANSSKLKAVSGPAAKTAPAPTPSATTTATTKKREGLF